MPKYRPGGWLAETSVSVLLHRSRLRVPQMRSGAQVNRSASKQCSCVRLSQASDSPVLIAHKDGAYLVLVSQSLCIVASVHGAQDS